MAQGPPDKAPLPDTLVMQRFDGLKNTVRSERLGPADLEVAVNIDLDDAGQASRRQGYRRVADGKWHSLWTLNDGQRALAVKDGQLGWLRPNFTHSPLCPGGDRPLAYTQIGEVVYWCSEIVSGKIVDGTVLPWGQETSPGVWVSPVLLPTDTLPAIAGRVMKRPPCAKYLCNNNGRIYLAVENVVWFTELFHPNAIDATRNYWMFEGEITMLMAVNDGIYVGTDEGCYFVGGTAVKPVRKRVMDGAVIPGSAVYIPAEISNPIAIQRKPDQELSVSIAFLTAHGYCIGGEGGNAYNMTEAKAVFPDATRAAALFRQKDGVNQYIAVTDSGGAAVGNTRIGDYADAEIRRGGARWRELDDVVLFGDRLDAEIVHH